MILLAADTSGKNGSLSLALVRQDAGSGVPSVDFQILDLVPLAGGTFSAQLVPQIAALLRKHGFTKLEIGAFVVVSGPGSFTGLRVGLAAIKALAEILGKPIAAVSLLEAVARSGQARGRVLSAVDAGRGEVYAGEYELGNRSRMLSERLITRAEFLALGRGRVVVTPDPALAGLARAARLQTEEVEQPQSDVIARLGWEKIQSSETISPEELEANYIRRSDAEIFAKDRTLP